MSTVKLNIVEANNEINRLTAELEKSQNALTAAQTAHTTALTEKDNAHAQELTLKDAKISELEKQLIAISGERDAARADVKTHAEKIAALEKEAKTVEQKASEIAANVGGVKPLAAANPADKTARVGAKEAWSRPFFKNS